jgi:zinc protease
MTKSLWDKYRSLPNAENITRVTLRNGIVALLRGNPHSQSIGLSGYLSVGAAIDPREKLGLAEFTAAALKYGTQQYDFQRIYQLLESTGANMSFSASVHHTTFAGRSLSEDLPMMLALLRETLEHPTFPEKEIGMLRDQMMTSLQIRAQDTRAQAALAFDRLLFDDQHPYGRPTDGFMKTLSAINIEDMRALHAAYYGPHGTVIALTGDIQVPAAIELLENCLGDWRNPLQMDMPALAAPTPPAAAQREHITIADKFQTDLVMGTPAPLRNSPDFLVGVIGNNILGQFGMMGRIGDVVRDKAGLAYHASTSLNAGKLGGAWEVHAGVNPANLERAIDLIRTELIRFCDTPVSSEEIEDSRANLIGRLPLSLESNGAVAMLLVRMEQYGLGLDYLRDYINTLQATTAEDIQQVAQRYIRFDQLMTASAGPVLVEEPTA